MCYAKCYCTMCFLSHRHTGQMCIPDLVCLLNKRFMWLNLYCKECCYSWSMSNKQNCNEQYGLCVPEWSWESRMLSTFWFCPCQTGGDHEQWDRQKEVLVPLFIIFPGTIINVFLIPLLCHACHYQEAVWFFFFFLRQGFAVAVKPNHGTLPATRRVYIAGVAV